MQKQRLKQEIGLKLSHQQIQFLGLLQIPLLSLEKRIEEELESNPALEEQSEGDKSSESGEQNWEKNIYLNCDLQKGSKKVIEKAFKNLIEQAHQNIYKSIKKITR